MGRWSDEQKGVGKTAALGARPMAPAGKRFVPAEADVLAACTFGGKVNQAAAAALRGGNFSMNTSGMVAKTLAEQWQSSTQAHKLGYVKKFMAYLRATGRQRLFFPQVNVARDGRIDVDVTCKDGGRPAAEEEQVLCEFAVIRVMSGNTLESAGGVISHLRTWSRGILAKEFGCVGVGGRMSVTSQYLKALEGSFPPENSKDQRRAPFTWEMVETFYKRSVQIRWQDPGVAIAIAYAGLFRMGELTATETRPFDALVDLAENDVTFRPTFWTADSVTIQLGVSKADRRGKKSLLRPRILPVYPGSPGEWLRNMLARRLGVQKGEEPVMRARPLFQTTNGKQLARDTVLNFVRQTLGKAGYTVAQQKEYGTHSARIGGATKLFQIGASPEVLKRMGGWSSDAYKSYIRMQQRDTMAFSRRMCGG